MIIRWNIDQAKKLKLITKLMWLINSIVEPNSLLEFCLKDRVHVLIQVRTSKQLAKKLPVTFVWKKILNLCGSEIKEKSFSDDYFYKLAHDKALSLLSLKRRDAWNSNERSVSRCCKLWTNNLSWPSRLFKFKASFLAQAPLLDDLAVATILANVSGCRRADQRSCLGHGIRRLVRGHRPRLPRTSGSCLVFFCSKRNRDCRWKFIFLAIIHSRPLVKWQLNMPRG